MLIRKFSNHSQRLESCLIPKVKVSVKIHVICEKGKSDLPVSNIQKENKKQSWRQVSTNS